MMAIGVARPSAHGQAMTSTLTARSIARSNGALASIQPAKVRTAMAMTTGTKIPLILSAMRAMGALEPWACCTSVMMLARAVSLPTLLARYCSAPVVFSVAA